MHFVCIIANNLVGGAAPTNVVAQQVGRESVLVSWNNIRPDFGYRVKLGLNISVDVQGSSRTLTIGAGTYNVEVIALFYPVSSQPARLTVVVRGK